MPYSDSSSGYSDSESERSLASVVAYSDSERSSARAGEHTFRFLMDDAIMQRRLQNDRHAVIEVSSTFRR